MSPCNVCIKDAQASNVHRADEGRVVQVDDVQSRKILLQPKKALERSAQRIAQDHPVHRRVGADDDVLLFFPGADFAKSGHDARGEFRHGFPVSRRPGMNEIPVMLIQTLWFLIAEACVRLPFPIAQVKLGEISGTITGWRPNPIASDRISAVLTERLSELA